MSPWQLPEFFNSAPWGDESAPAPTGVARASLFPVTPDHPAPPSPGAAHNAPPREQVAADDPVSSRRRPTCPVCRGSGVWEQDEWSGAWEMCEACEGSGVKGGHQ